MIISFQKDYNIELHDNGNLVDKYTIHNLITDSKFAILKTTINANHYDLEIYSTNNDYLGDIEAEIKIELLIKFSIDELIYFLYNLGQECQMDDLQIEVINLEILNYKSIDKIDTKTTYLKNCINEYYNSQNDELMIKFS